MLLDEVGRHLPPDAWLVTYNGRGFDWPLLVTRYRMVRRAAPPIGGHLDLLPHRAAVVPTSPRRRAPRDRRADAARADTGRRRRRLGDPGPVSRVPARRSCPAAGRRRAPQRRGCPLARTPARTRRAAPRRSGGPFVGATRGPRRSGPRLPTRATARGGDRLSRCRPRRGADHRAGRGTRRVSDRRAAVPEEPWWSPRRRADFGGRPETRRVTTGWDRREAFSRPWDEGRIAVDRAHLLRRLGRVDEAIEAWDALACGPGRTAVVAAIEAAKLREHRLGRSGRGDGRRRARSAPGRPPASPGDAGTGARSRPSPSLATLASIDSPERQPELGACPEGRSDRTGQGVERRAVVRRRKVEHHGARPRVPIARAARR